MLQFIDPAVANKPDQDVFPLPVSVLGELIWARRVRLHTTTTLSISSTQASGRKYLAPCRTPLRKGQNSRQNPSHTSINKFMFFIEEDNAPDTYIEKSPIGGFGLFASKNFNKDEIILDYNPFIKGFYKINWKE